MKSYSIWKRCGVLRDRGSAILIENNKVVLIKRTINGQVYYVFPGGGIEKGERPEKTTIREVMEELGVRIRIDSCFDQVPYNGTQYYFLASIIDGTFGTGTGDEFKERARGHYEPIWIDIASLASMDVRPKEIAAKIQAFIFLGEANEQ